MCFALLLGELVCIYAGTATVPKAAFSFFVGGGR